MRKLWRYLEGTRQPKETAYQRYERFGMVLGVSGYCVRKWVYGQRRVNDRMKLKIARVTQGQIKVQDLVRG
jgi:DNA-binding transcriptional regulator YdaS (Cro superfamily)